MNTTNIDANANVIWNSMFVQHSILQRYPNSLFIVISGLQTGKLKSVFVPDGTAFEPTQSPEAEQSVVPGRYPLVILQLSVIAAPSVVDVASKYGPPEFPALISTTGGTEVKVVAVELAVQGLGPNAFLPRKRYAYVVPGSNPVF